MEEAKRKKIEEKLRQMLKSMDQPHETTQPDAQVSPVRRSGVRVIRRRKGVPDLQIA